jgi:hypothetical protein
MESTPDPQSIEIEPKVEENIVEESKESSQEHPKEEEKTEDPQPEDENENDQTVILERNENIIIEEEKFVKKVVTMSLTNLSEDILKNAESPLKISKVGLDLTKLSPKPFVEQ